VFRSGIAAARGNVATALATLPLSEDVRSAPMAVSGRSRFGEPRQLLFVAALAGTVFWLAYDGGTYGVVSRGTVGVLAVWLLAAGVATRVLPRQRLGASAVMVLTGLAALTCWTWLSVSWAPNAGSAVAEANRMVLYTVATTLVILGARRDRIDLWLDGLAVGIAVVGAFALASRLFPAVFGTNQALAEIPLGERRLSYPLGYWNALSAFVALGLPLSIRTVLRGRSLVVRAVTAGLVPACIATMFLTSSRGGTLSAVVGLLVLFLICPTRVAALAAIAVTGAGAAVAVIVVRSRNAVVNGPFTTSAAIAEGRGAALWVVLCCALTAIAALIGIWALRERVRVPAVAERVVLVLGVVVVLAGVIAEHPLRRFDAFRAQPAAFASQDYVEKHLLSGNGNGRWQLWQTAMEEFRAHPVLGGGPGTYGPYQTQHGKLHVFVVDAHSLYVQTLAELGVIGLLALVTAFAGGVVAVVATLRRRASAGERLAVAAAAGSFAAFATSCAFDWTWQLPAVALPALVSLALLSRLGFRPGEQQGADPSRRARPVLIAITASLAIPLLWGQAAMLVSQMRLDASQAAASKNDLAAAMSAAQGARNATPWSAAPYLELALLDERASRLESAEQWAADATRRAPNDWRTWLVRTRIATKRGDVPTAVASLARLKELNPELQLPTFAGQ
jgi:hypothetical protein